jgi:hypothetical protein
MRLADHGVGPISVLRGRRHLEFLDPEPPDGQFINFQLRDGCVLDARSSNTQRANRNCADGQGSEGRCTNGHCYKRSRRRRNDLQRCMHILTHQFILS